MYAGGYAFAFLIDITNFGVIFEYIYVNINIHILDQLTLERGEVPSGTNSQHNLACMHFLFGYVLCIALVEASLISKQLGA
jgi:hypothetical protein